MANRNFSLETWQSRVRISRSLRVFGFGQTKPDIKSLALECGGDFVNRSPVWTKQFLTIAAINLLLTLVVFLLIVIIGGYAIKAYSANPSEAGLVAGVFVIGILVGRICFG